MGFHQLHGSVNMADENNESLLAGKCIMGGG